MFPDRFHGSFDKLIIILIHVQTLAVLERLRISNIVNCTAVRFDDLFDRLNVDTKELLPKVDLVNPMFMELSVQRVFQ